MSQLEIDQLKIQTETRAKLLHESAAMIAAMKRHLLEYKAELEACLEDLELHKQIREAQGNMITRLRAEVKSVRQTLLDRQLEVNHEPAMAYLRTELEACQKERDIASGLAKMNLTMVKKIRERSKQLEVAAAQCFPDSKLEDFWGAQDLWNALDAYRMDRV